MNLMKLEYNMRETRNYFLGIMMLMFSLSTSVFSQPPDLTSLKGPYLGQTPPGTAPQIFAPGIISTDATEFGITISMDGNEIYVTRRVSRDIGNRIVSYNNESGNWVLDDSIWFDWDGWNLEPNISSDGKRLYFGSRRPKPENSPTSTLPVQWYVEKEQNSWSVPKLLGSPVIETGNMFLTQANSGTIYFTGMTPKKGIYSANKTGDGFEKPVYLPKEINHLVNPAYPKYFNPAHPYISPDESFIIYDNAIDDKWTTNLFISFKKDGQWIKDVNLTKYLEFDGKSFCPFVTFDGKYLFFSSGGNIYWVDASFIDELRPKS